MDYQTPHVVLLGGGTGSYELLLGLKAWTPHITAIVNMCDDGGSTGRLRRDYDVLPPGDVRQCLAALSTRSDMAELFSYRFDGGELGGHAVGNILLAALELQNGSFTRAIEQASRMLGVTGSVLPVTLEKHALVMQDGDLAVRGQEAVREHTIRNPGNVRLYCDPAAAISPAAVKAIAEADLVIIAPGGLYWTLLPMCTVDGLADALREARAKKICVTNLMNRPEQHRGWHVVDYVKAFQTYLGEGVIDTVLYNTEAVSPDLLERYASEGEAIVDTEPERFTEVTAQFVGAELVAAAPALLNPADTQIARTRIRHDGTKTTAAIRKVFY